MVKNLYAIFVNYNGGSRFYEGVTFSLASPTVKGVVVIDNGSKDDSLKQIYTIKTKKNLIIVKNRTNRGFNKAVNQGMKKALQNKADAVMPMDFDLGFHHDFITKIAKVDADFVAPILKSKVNNRTSYDYGGRMNWVTGMQSHLTSNRYISTIGRLSTSSRKHEKYWIDFVSGGCTIIKKEVIEKIGYLDEDYFVYWGDAEYALRARDAGFNVVMDGETVVDHYYEYSRKTLNQHKLKISFLDNLTFIRKKIKWYYKPIAYISITLLSIRVFTVFFAAVVERLLKQLTTRGSI